MRKSKKRKSKIRNYRKQIIVFWMIFLIGLFSAVGIFLAAAYGLMGPMPALEQLENPKTNLATQILSSDGEVLGKFYFNENRTPITYKELPQNIIDLSLIHI